MNRDDSAGTAVWSDALLAATVLAIDGCGLGGVRLRARAGPVRDRWLAIVRALCPDQPMPRLPLHADADRLGGGLDLAATLSAGRPVAEQGLLRQADGGVLLVAMAERLEPGMAAAIGTVLDTGRVHAAVQVSDDGGDPVRFAVVALDEGAEPDERTPAGLADRLALHIDLEAVSVRDLTPEQFDARAIAAARENLIGIEADGSALETLCTVSLALGIGSLRAPWLALRVARALAALHGRSLVAEEDLAAAARLVLAPRATTFPASDEENDQAQEAPEDEDAPEDQDAPESTDPSPQEPTADETRPPDEQPEAENGMPASDDSDAGRESPGADEQAVESVLEATRARVPPGLLEASLAARAGRTRQGAGGKSGALRQAGVRGRPAGVRRGQPGANARLNLIETLRAAAPWQRIRGGLSADGPRVRVRKDDFRVTRFKARQETTTVFVVDASGSSALHRLAEVKGAVELLLADCYVRRDQVALISFRGTGAEVLLPPTRSLVQAKRRLAELAGGGGTPLAAGVERALELTDGIIRRGATPVIVALTDGRANIAADGSPGREQAHLDAIAAGRRLQAAGVTVMLVDTSPRPRPLGKELAAAMGARYIPLPHADAAHLSAAVRAQTQAT